jgi:hypothetical protein
MIFTHGEIESKLVLMLEMESFPVAIAVSAGEEKLR